MKRIYLLVLIGLSSTAWAQTPWQRVYTVLNTKCQNSTCHSASSADALKFDQPEANVYSALIDINPQNAISQSKKEKLIKRGHPYSSFMLRKIAGAPFDTDLALEAGEGDLMKDINGNQLSDAEIEYLRQWIMTAARKTYTASQQQPDWNMISDYYANPQYPFLAKPPKPNPGEGIQLRMGPVFVPATTTENEIELLLQSEVNFPILPEVYRIEGFMNDQSHHFLLFRFDDSVAAYQRAFGLDEVGGSTFGQGTAFDGDKQLTSAWQDNAEFVLPEGTALFWPLKTYLDMNYHIKNYGNTGALPCDFYFNVYFRPRSTSTIEMKAQIVNNPLLFLSQGSQTRYYEDNDNGNNETRYLFNLASHSHKYGVDFDLFTFDPSAPNNLGEQIYEGFYNYDYTANLGYYDWEHPAIRTFDPLYPIDYKNSGMIARTVWEVTEAFVTFGFTTEDEMQLWYYMYTNQLPTGMEEKVRKNLNMRLYPNPTREKALVQYKLDNAADVRCMVYDFTGREVASFQPGFQSAGTYNLTLDDVTATLPSGMYQVSLSINGIAETKKMVIAD